MQIISHSRHEANISQTERWVSGIGGGLLVGWGIGMRSRGGVGLALAGAALLRRGITGYCRVYQALGFRTAPKGQGAETTSVPYELGIRVDKAVTIGLPRPEVFRFYRNFSNLPRFMKHVQAVRELGDNRSHWVVAAPAGRRVEWDAVIHNEIENQLIAWRSLPGADVDNAGSVWFKDAPGGRGTEVKVELQYNPPAGAAGALVAAMFGKEAGTQVEEDLRRLKQILETGEIPTTEGQSSGREVNRAAHGRRRSEREVEHASKASFPASDAPAYNR